MVGHEILDNLEGDRLLLGVEKVPEGLVGEGQDEVSPGEAGVGDQALRDVINKLLAEGHKKIVVNLTAVTRMDSSGLGELVAAEITGSPAPEYAMAFHLNRYEDPAYQSMLSAWSDSWQL